jgi:NitT/TauT family transport system substrate-binding protein
VGRVGLFCLAALLCGAGPAAAQAPVSLTIGIVPSVPAGATWIAIEKGYFREAGVEVQLEKIDSASNAMALLASGRMEVVEGGLAAGYWNALAQKLPMIMALERGSSPVYHDLLVRPDLVGQIKTIADLKGRTVAIVAPGSSAFYEVGKTLETAGLTLKDVEIKYMPFPQMGVAFANKAIDVADEVPPFGSVIVAEKLAARWIDPDDYIKPQPTSFIAYMANTDWAAKNPDLARKFFLALVKGGRDYCQAYHNGPNRQEVEDILWKYKAVNDRELLHTMPWQARDPNGRFNMASVLDVQDWYLKEKMITQKFPAERLIDASYADYAEKQLPPFQVINKDSKLAGCR